MTERSEQPVDAAADPNGRTLVLLRHAKAEFPGSGTDYDRGLTTRGQRDADAAGSWLAAQALRPDLVICSPAVRTRETWHAVAVALAAADPAGSGAEVRYEATLYDSGRTEVIDLLRAVPDAFGTVLVIGHNPTMSDVSELLAPEQPAVVLRTCGVAVHRPAGSWSRTEPGSAVRIQAHTARA